MQTLNDMKYCLRLLCKTPQFTAITLAVVALGLTLFIVSYTFTRETTREAMPFSQGDRYVTLGRADSVSSFMYFDGAYDVYSFNFLKSRVESYTAFGAFYGDDFVLSDGQRAQEYRGAAISADFLEAMSVSPLLGRIFTFNDANSGADDVIILGHSVWQDFLGGDNKVLGRVVAINGSSYTVIGVMPEGFRFPTSHQFWFPLTVSESVLPNEGEPLSLFGILQDDVGHETAQSELNSLMSQLQSEYPNDYFNRSEVVVPYAARLDSSGIAGAIMLGTTLIILLLAIINLSSLLFLRAASRQQELAVRSSVGASNWQLTRQVLTESSLICGLGLVLSLLISAVLLRVLHGQYIIDGELPFWFDLKPNSQVILAALGSTISVWLASSLLACVKTLKSKPGEILNSGNRSGNARSRNLSARVIVATEVILSCFLLICCGALVYLMIRIINNDYGVSTENYVVGEMDFSAATYDVDARYRYFIDLRQSLAALPGVLEIAATTALPGQPGTAGVFELADRDARLDGQLPAQNTIWVSANYFSAMDVDLIQGRYFDGNDSSSAQDVVIVSEQFARQLWPNEAAPGKRIKATSSDSETWLTVVGTTSTIEQFPLRIGRAVPSLYRPITQGPPEHFLPIIKHRADQNPRELAARIQDAAIAIDREIPLTQVKTFEENLAQYRVSFHVLIQLFLLFAGTTVFLAGIGIYGVIARSIAQRTHEIGIRRALGSVNSNIVSHFVMQGVNFLIVGALIGGAPAAIVLATYITSLSPSISLITFMPAVCLVVGLIMASIILVASYFPARTAVILEPGDALRYE